MRMLVCLCMAVSASPAFAQSFYLGGFVGADTMIAGTTEVDGRDTIDDSGTAPSVAWRAGLALGDRWGAEVEVSYGFTRERTDTSSTDAFAPVITFPPAPALVPFESTLRIQSERQLTAISPVAWFSTPLGARVDLVLAAGVSFNRTRLERQYELEFDLPSRILPRGLTFRPESITTTTYDTEPLVGAEARVAFGEHVRLVPALRVAGTDGGWLVRPQLGLAWMF